MESPERQSDHRAPRPEPTSPHLSATPSRPRRGILRRLAPRLAIVAVATLVALASVEIYFRVRFPFGEAAWPSEFDARVGFRFVPGAEVRWSNFLDYATVTRANSLGFLDREPPGERAPNEFRIAVLGDSFVEAAQVPIDEKLHVQLERLLSEAMPERRFRASAFGYSGCGTSNVLPFYDEFAHAQDPDLVVLVFVSNDLANNSPLLESIRNGWRPYTPPRVFFEADESGLREIPIAADWAEHVLQVEPAPSAPPIAGADWLGWSRTYAFVAANLRHRRSSTAHLDLYARRKAALEALDPSFAAALAGFDPRVDDLDTTFFAAELPPVFERALRSTERSFVELKKRAAADGAEVLVLVHDGCSGSRTLSAGRECLADGYRDRVMAAAGAAGLTCVDLGATFAARGDLAGTRFAHDGHWSPTGHRWAAESAAEFLLEHRDEYLPGSPR
ncbi:MAG: SGNH/GDSL hydrolase family protein [Planctomycetes bacterium]|nr:SGNH/GDSL hydrolase family protein [Planctomycetota bacterium]